MVALNLLRSSYGETILSLTFESVDKILWSYHSNETSLVELLHGVTCFLGFYKKGLWRGLDHQPLPQANILP